MGTFPNQRSLGHLSTLLFERTDWLLQMEQKFSGHSGRNGKRGIPLKVFLFFRKISSGKARSI